jgi:hypothetical protein
MYFTLTGSYLDSIKKSVSDETLPKETLDMLEELKGVACCSHVSFDKGEIAAAGKTYYPNAEAEKKYKDISASIMDKLKGEQLKLIPENAILAFSANIKGSGLYDYLDKLGLYSFIEERDRDGLIKTVLGKNILSEIDGDITIALTDIASPKTSPEPQFIFLVDCKDGAKALDRLDTIISGEGGSLEKIAPDIYVYEKTFIAVKGNTLSITNNKSSFDNPSAATALSALSKGNLAVLGGDFKMLKKVASQNIPDRDASGIASGLTDLFDTYQFSGKLNVAEGKIIMTDRNRNSLASFCQWLDKTLTSLNDKLSF